MSEPLVASDSQIIERSPHVDLSLVGITRLDRVEHASLVQVG
jgi:hypothetical protein